MSVRQGQPQTGSAATNVSADVNMAAVGVDDFTVNVIFVVTSLAAGNDTCFTSKEGE